MRPEHQVSGLLQLAQRRWGRLTVAEQRVLVAVKTGTIAHCSPQGTCPQTPDPLVLVRAKVLEWLATDPQALAHWTHRGLGVQGAWVAGIWDLAHATVAQGLSLQKCYFTDPLRFPGAWLKSLDLGGSRFAALEGSHLHIATDLGLEGVQCWGRWNLRLARIGGDIRASRAQLDPQGIFAHGSPETQTNPQSCPQSWASPPLPYDPSVLALRGDNPPPHIPPSPAPSPDPPSPWVWIGSAMEVGGHVVLDQGFQVGGPITWAGAWVRGSVVMQGGELRGRGTIALDGQGLTVGGDLRLHNGLAIQGRVCLAYAQIHHTLALHHLEHPMGLHLDLQFARAGCLQDDRHSWPDRRNLRLQGFIYGSLSQESPHCSRLRTDWLRRMPHFVPQPYDHLAQVLRESGHDFAAQAIIQAKWHDRLRHAQYQGHLNLLLRCYLWLHGSFRGLWSRMVSLGHSRLLSHGPRPPA